MKKPYARRNSLFYSLLALCLLLPAQWATAQALYYRHGEDEPLAGERLLLPYAFNSEDIGLSFGLAGVFGGWPQEQSFAMATAFVSDKGTVFGLLMGINWRIPGTERLFVDPYVSVADWAELRVYSGYNPEFPTEIPGANDSSEDNYGQIQTLEVWTFLDFKYVLPIGHGRDNPICHYHLENGLLASGASGGTSWNPMKSGRTLIRFRPEFRRQDLGLAGFEEETGYKPVAATLNYRLTLEHDNRNFTPNPTRGSRVELHVTHDPALLTETPDEWVVLEADLAAYITVVDAPGLKQSVLALNLWTASTPTWDRRDETELRMFADGAPPYYKGASLGGFFRLKAYPTGRFNDKSAIYYSAEYRVIPAWQPLARWKWLQRMNFKWWQFTLLGEAGRVGPEYDLALLHEDMHWDVGLGVNVMLGSGIGRLDWVVGPEGAAIAVMAGQTF